MTDTSPRSALERMIYDLDVWCDTWHPLAYTDPRISLRLIADHARAALAEGAGVGVTDEDLAAAALKALESHRYATELPYFLSPDSSEYEPFMLTFRAAIARYGTHPRPIPVAERLPAEVIEQAWKQYSKTPTFNDDEVLSLEGFRAAVADILAAAIPLPEVDS